MEYNDTVIIELDRVRVLRAGHKAIKKISSMLGKPVQQAIDQVTKAEFTGKQLEEVLFCLLEQDAKDHNETLTVNAMEDLIDTVPYGVILAKLGLAISAAFPNTDDQGEIAEKNAPTETDSEASAGMIS